MEQTYDIYHRNLRFKFLAGTSRGYYKTHPVWYVLARNGQGAVTGFGEAAPLAGLSPEYSDNATYSSLLTRFIEQLNAGIAPQDTELRKASSIRFALEMLQRMQKRGPRPLYDNAFTEGKRPILINGLIWMGDFQTMEQRLEEKIAAGFHCIKVKIGAIDFDEEIALLAKIRSRFDASAITLRVDANGAFTPEEAAEKLRILADFDIHSIEQPIKAGNLSALKTLCQTSPVPIALDEELIGHVTAAEKAQLLDFVRPHYIVLKPTLHGGFSGAQEWIDAAKPLGIDYWMTSALESNIGLSAISQFAGELAPTLPQGLGTGQLYENNVEDPSLTLIGEKLFFEAEKFSADSLAQQIISGN